MKLGSPRGSERINWRENERLKDVTCKRMSKPEEAQPNQPLRAELSADLVVSDRIQAHTATALLNGNFYF